ncbi:thermonuclease family protein [Candidatus Avelusimicrobium fimicolum]|uniref:thermonuclease family protein n=1 Tax=Candidatus Avelusimicrobium fimicolum TaxID=3416216 RepID=UPI003D0ECB2E
MYKQTVISFLLLCFSFPLFAQQPTSNFYKVRLGKVMDGDTFKVYLACSYKLFCKSVSVRVRGIDTPELKSKDAAKRAKAQEAKRFTQQFLTGHKIVLKRCTRDKYFRLLCEVYADNKSLADALLAANLAISYNGGSR